MGSSFLGIVSCFDPWVDICVNSGGKNLAVVSSDSFFLLPFISWDFDHKYYRPLDVVLSVTEALGFPTFSCISVWAFQGDIFAFTSFFPVNFSFLIR